MLISKDNCSDHTQPHQITANYPFRFVLSVGFVRTMSRSIDRSFNSNQVSWFAEPDLSKIKEDNIKFPLFNH